MFVGIKNEKNRLFNFINISLFNKTRKKGRDFKSLSFSSVETIILHTTISSYLESAFNPNLIKFARKELRKIEFDTLIGVGLSGSIVVPLLANKLNKYFAIVRKENDSNHAEYSIEGSIGNKWIFVYDFIDSGDTFHYVKNKVDIYCNNTYFIGVFLYHLFTEPKLITIYGLKFKCGFIKA